MTSYERGGCKRFSALAAVLLVCIGLGTLSYSETASAKTAPQPDPSAEELSNCLAEKRRLAVLWLIDQSRSLASDPQKGREGTDPFGLRAIPLTATAQVLTSLARAEVGEELEIFASVVGFGKGATVKLDWTDITNETADELEDVIDRESRFAQDLYTQYDQALRVTLKQFENPTTTDSCRLVFWFSDGEHDADDISGLSPQERRQVQSDICGNGGLADQLRDLGVQLWAVGLNPRPEKLELMHLVSENRGGYRSGDVNINEGQCGSSPARGTYIPAEKVDRIADIIVALPGLPDEPVSTTACGIAECSEIRFKADSSIAGFKMRLTRPSNGVKVEITLPSQEKLEVFAESAPGKIERSREARVGPIRVIRISSNESLVIARGSDAEPLEGEWAVQFIGEGADSAEGRISFEGEVRIAVINDEGVEVDTIDRYEPVPIRIRIVDGSGLNPVNPSGLSVTLAGTGDGGASDQKLAVERDDDAWRIPSKAVGSALQGALKSELAVEFRAIPTATVKGLRGPDGEPIPIVFRETSVLLGVSNGKNYPTFIPSEDASEIRVQDTNRFVVAFRFRGPDAVDGEVSLKGFAEPFPNENGFELSGDEVCVIPAQSETTCTFFVTPQRDGYGDLSLPIELLLNSERAEQPQPQTVSVGIFLTRNPDVGKGIRNAIALVVGFLLVQFVIRFITALALSRFERLDSTARRVRIPVRVFSDGNVAGPSRADLVAADPGTPDNMFASELLERQRNFSVFGYNFASSVAKTFLRPMNRPFGEASSPGLHVIGSAGASVPSAKKIDSGYSNGRVELALRRQWLLGLTSAEIRRLTTSENGVEGELVAFLDPTEFSPSAEQLADLQTTISGSQLGTDLSVIAERLKESDEQTRQKGDDGAAAQVQSTDAVAQSASNLDPFNFGSDPFGDSEFAAAPTDETVIKKARTKRLRKSQSFDQQSGVDGDSFSFGPDDPFS